LVSEEVPQQAAGCKRALAFAVIERSDQRALDNEIVTQVETESIWDRRALALCAIERPSRGIYRSFDGRSAKRYEITAKRRRDGQIRLQGGE